MHDWRSSNPKSSDPWLRDSYISLMSLKLAGFLGFVVSLCVPSFATLNPVSNYSHAIVFIRFSKVGLVKTKIFNDAFRGIASEFSRCKGFMLDGL